MMAAATRSTGTMSSRALGWAATLRCPFMMRKAGGAALVLEAGGGAVAEHRDVRAVVGLLLDLGDDPLAVGDLGVDAEVVVAPLPARSAPLRVAPPAGEARLGPPPARVVAHERLVLPDLAVAVAGDEAGGDVDDAGAGLPGHAEGVLHAQG